MRKFKILLHQAFSTTLLYGEAPRQGPRLTFEWVGEPDCMYGEAPTRPGNSELGQILPKQADRSNLSLSIKTCPVPALIISGKGSTFARNGFSERNQSHVAPPNSDITMVWKSSQQVNAMCHWKPFYGCHYSSRGGVLLDYFAGQWFFLQKIWLSKSLYT